MKSNQRPLATVGRVMATPAARLSTTRAPESVASRSLEAVVTEMTLREAAMVPVNTWAAFSSEAAVCQAEPS
jgi:hypothetical protein